MQNTACEEIGCTNAVLKDQQENSIRLVSRIYCLFHLRQKLRLREVIDTILRYLRNGQGLNDVVESTDITQNEALEAVELIQRALQAKLI